MNHAAKTNAGSRLKILEETPAVRKLGDDAANLFFGLAELEEFKAEVRSAASAEKDNDPWVCTKLKNRRRKVIFQTLLFHR